MTKPIAGAITNRISISARNPFMWSCTVSCQYRNAHTMLIAP